MRQTASQSFSASPIMWVERMTVLPRTPAAKYLELFNLFDIALDPFPYNGGVTTCDALWMGVPVVTLAGVRATSRGGVAILSNVRLPQLIARSREQLIEDRRVVLVQGPRRDVLRRHPARLHGIHGVRGPL